MLENFISSSGDSTLSLGLCQPPRIGEEAELVILKVETGRRTRETKTDCGFCVAVFSGCKIEAS